MKVYATMLQDNKVILVIYPTIKKFESINNWCDKKFINVVKLTDLKNFEFSNERSMIIYSSNEKTSHLLLRKEFLKVMK